MMPMTKSNILIFPLINVTLVQLANFWRGNGFALANTKHGNLCLVEIDNLEQEHEHICTGQESSDSGTATP